MSASTCLFLRLPLELRQQIYRDIFPSPIPPHPTPQALIDEGEPDSHDLTDHRPAFHRLSNPRAEALCLAFPHLSQEITAEFRRNCTTLVFHARADEEWTLPPEDEEFKYLKLEEVEIFIETRSSPMRDAHVRILRRNMQRFVHFLGQKFKRVPLLRVEYELDYGVYWDHYIGKGADQHMTYSYVLSPLRKLRTKVLHVDIDVPEGWEFGDDREELDDFRYPLIRDIQREGWDDAARRGVKFLY